MTEGSAMTFIGMDVSKNTIAIALLRHPPSGCDHQDRQRAPAAHPRRGGLVRAEPAIVRANLPSPRPGSGSRSGAVRDAGPGAPPPAVLADGPARQAQPGRDRRGRARVRRLCLGSHDRTDREHVTMRTERAHPGVRGRVLWRDPRCSYVADHGPSHASSGGQPPANHRHAGPIREYQRGEAPLPRVRALPFALAPPRSVDRPRHISYRLRTPSRASPRARADREGRG